ncbi:hypothetical protein G5G45_004082, partial [Vibrio vulnificus]|nr:hypothetical protein [Vibrio vulnificus]
MSIIGLAGQITIGRFTSKYKYNNDNERLKKLFDTYVSFILISIMAFIIVLCLVLLFFSNIFPQIPPEIVYDAKIAFSLIFGSFIVGLLSTAFIGYFIGIERNFVIANINVISRIVIGISIVYTADYGLTSIAIIYFSVNCISYFMMYRQFKNFENYKFSFSFSSELSDILKFWGGLSIWNVAQFLISGIGVFVVSIYDFDNLAYFVLAMTMVNAIVGILGAIVNPVIQPIVKLTESGRFQTVDNLVVSLSMVFSLCILLGVVLSSYLSLPILQIWVGQENGQKANEYFNLLLAAFAIRMAVAPYGMKLVAHAQQLKIAHFPVLEGLINFILSIYFVSQFGAIGIAYATFVAAILIMLMYSTRFIKETITNSKNFEIYTSFFVVPVLTVMLSFSSTDIISNIEVEIIVIQVIFSCVAI